MKKIQNMISIKELAWNVTEEEYRADPALSYSTLSRFEREGWRNLSSLFDKQDTPALLFGSAVDCMLTDGEQAFNDRFIVCEFPNLSDNLIIITRSLYSKYGDTHRRVDTIDDEVISEIAVANGYYAGASYKATRIKKIKENCNEYYSLLALAGNKTIISQSDYNDVSICVGELETNPVTKEFFFINPWEPHIEKLFQLKFKAEWNGIPVRCMFDELIVDHVNKVIYPIDLKTTGYPEEEFQHSFMKWRYDIQAMLYTYILQECIKRDPYFSQFKIQHYQFIVINRRTVAPIIWKFHGNFGTVDLKDEEGNIYRNWRKILTDLNYYLNSSNLKYSKEVIENNCIMQIKSLVPA
ncbi:PD-(D/E)XK superfamily exonuclease [uncultured phage cr106_1]|uniref:PD-(D/E)XK superfamily exonuclease n=1 Tax=uncultured phage cr106_1 TaxID=2772062 RepID=A0A7M1RW16_9CAUD|nr:PD-(D/E)XK superfamily exonuclease [uncultured phage cr106_1]QOR58324.1 PD-(D/E)XK superfamily exonuclease [uncultured phage cr106_1]